MIDIDIDIDNLKFDERGLIPSYADAQNNNTLMLAYMNWES